MQPAEPEEPAQFQSTPPARGATVQASAVCQGVTFQSTPPARGATVCYRYTTPQYLISIHAPREGGDLSPRVADRSAFISIHAPREGGDLPYSRDRLPAPIYFNPRPPRGGRPARFPVLLEGVGFQSTPPARGATPLHGIPQGIPRHFNPRPPRGGRHQPDA